MSKNILTFSAYLRNSNKCNEHKHKLYHISIPHNNSSIIYKINFLHKREELHISNNNIYLKEFLLYTNTTIITKMARL